MIESYTTDLIKIITTEYDEFGAITESESDNINARIEDTNELIRDVNGKEIKANMVIIFDYDKEIKYQDKSKIVKKNGNEYNQPDKKWEIKKKESLGMFAKTHYEVYI